MHLLAGSERERESCAEVENERRNGRRLLIYLLHSQITLEYTNSTRKFTHMSLSVFSLISKFPLIYLFSYFKKKPSKIFNLSINNINMLTGAGVVVVLHFFGPHFHYGCLFIYIYYLPKVLVNFRCYFEVI